MHHRGSGSIYPTYVVFLLAFTSAAYGNEVSSTQVHSALAIVRQAQLDQHLHGAAAIMDSEGHTHRIMTGSADDASDTAINEKTRFRLASLTKLFTQLALLRLADEGRLDLDAPLSKYRPRLVASWSDRVTVRDLLTFRSGLPREWGEDSETSGVTFDDTGRASSFLDGLGNVGPTVEPRSRTQYSNLGYMHLGAAIEEITGQTYASAVSQLVVQPAGLSDTGFGADQLGADGHIRGYERAADGTLRPVRPLAVSRRYSAGGMYGSLGDLERISSAILDGGLLSAQSTDELFTQFGRPGAADSFRLEAAGHVPGFANAWIISRRPRFFVILLNNVVNDSPQSIIDVARSTASVFDPDTASAPTSESLTQEGWTLVSSFDEIPGRPSSPVIGEFVRSIASGDRDRLYDSMIALHGLDPATIAEATRTDTKQSAANQLNMFERFGPFQLVAWRRGEKDALECLLQGPQGRSIRYSFVASRKNAAVISEQRLATIGFKP